MSSVLTSGLKRRRTFPARRRGLGGAYFGETPPVTFPSSFLTTRVYIALGADLTASYLTWNWLDITNRVRHDLGITVEAGRRDERSKVTPSRCQIKLSNADGYMCRLNPFSPYYGLLTRNTPIWIQLNPGSGYVDRYFGYVNEWPPQWADETGNNAFVTIQCSGVLRRLAQGTVLKSALNRSVSGVAEGDFVPYAYWPMEDGSSATSFASAIAGHPAMTISGDIDLAANDDLVGSDPLPTFSTGASATGLVPAYTPTTQWVVMFAMRVPSEPASKTTYVEFTAPGSTEAVWRVQVDPTISPAWVQFETYDNTGNLNNQILIAELNGSSESSPSEADFYGTWATYFIAAIDAGGGLVTHWSGLTIGTTIGLNQLGSLETHASITSVKPMAGNGAAFGHFAVFTDPAFTLSAINADANNNAAAAHGHAGEMAHERIARLCREEGVPVGCQAATSSTMGPQPTGTLLELLRECEEADQGVLYEHQFGLAYQALSERYNQPVALTLDFDAGHHARVPQPTDDDQRLINKFTASRRGGSSATAEKTDGTLGTGAGGSGVFDASATVNVELDTQLPDYASWKVHLGTVDEYRWPHLQFQLHRNSGLIDDWLATPFGARINALNPPTQMNQDTANAVLEGYGERWVQEAWDVALVTSPASPYRTFTLEDAADPDLGRIDSGSSTLAAGASSGATSLSIATSNAADLWSTAGADYPLTLRIAGIDVTVSAMSGASSPQTATVTGVTKDLTAGAAVELANPTYLGI